jgi:hypothetical protein
VRHVACNCTTMKPPPVPPKLRMPAVRLEGQLEAGQAE